MQLTYDYVRDTVASGGVEYPLSQLRQWLAKNEPSLVESHFIKVVSVEGKRKATFDWYNIYQVAEDTGIISLQFKNIWKEANN